MINFRKILLFAVCLCGFGACRQAPILQDFDAQAWKQDRLACKGERAKLFASLSAQKSKLKGLGQNQILQILGKPDFHELAGRNQRYYIYYYKSGAPCKGGKPNFQLDAVLKVRFNAIDSVNEITW